MNHTLQVYPSSRALRMISQNHREQEGFLPALMRMDEFESRAVLPEDEVLFVDPLQRILLLREAASSELLAALKIRKELVDFFGRSDALFKFYEELSAEGVSFDDLRQADAYAEFDTHLNILEALLQSYHSLLQKHGMTDKVFLPKGYRLNKGFLQNYTKIEIFLEGYLSRYELTLLAEAATVTPTTVHYQTSRFNQKMQQRFEELGIGLPNNSEVSFDLGAKKIFKAVPTTHTVNAEVIAAKERIEQVSLALEAIEKMVREGIAPEHIALVLPDEQFKQHLMLFDALDNLNFAMGYDYTDHHHYKSLETLYRYWQTHDAKQMQLIEKYGMQRDQIETLQPAKAVEVEQFFEMLEVLHLLGVDPEQKSYHSEAEAQYRSFLTLFASQKLPFKEWLFLWLKSLSKITIDDVRGGKVTVLGVLETRGVTFEGVVIVDFNEGIVPASSAKDQFLNSAVRRYASLPTRSDREALQKQYYKRLLEGAQKATIIYDSSEEKLPSKFLYELGLESTEVTEGDLGLLYPRSATLPPLNDPVVDCFDAQQMQWSASRFKTFLECKRKFYYRYIRQIKAKEEDELNEGAFLHTLLEHLHRDHDHYESAEEIMAQIDRLLDTLLPLQDAKSRYHKLLWREKLKSYAQSQVEHFAQGWRVVEREKEFACEIAGLRFGGRIDRIDQNASQTLVIDYKSGNVPKEPKKFAPEKITDFQMPIYYRMLQRRYQNLSLAYCKILEQGKMQEVMHLDERLVLLDEKVSKLRRTDGFVAERCEDLSRCTYCEFRLMCGRGEYL